MANDFIGISISGDKQFIAKLNRLPKEAQNLGTESANDYIIEIMRAYAPYKYIPRKVFGWASEKQRKFVMAKISKGEIDMPYKRTQGLRNAWKKVGDGVNQIVVNETPNAKFVMGERTQARRFSLMGWETEETRVKTRMPKILQKFDEGVRKAIKKLGL